MTLRVIIEEENLLIPAYEKRLVQILFSVDKFAHHIRRV